MTGYDIKKTVANRMSYFWDLSYGQIYPTLKTLEEDGLITKQIQQNQNRPDKKMYTITDSGRNQLRAWLSKPAKKETHKYEVLLKIIFGDQANLQINEKHLQEFRENNQKIFDTMTEFENSILPNLKQNDQYFYVLLTVLLGKNISKASVEWADTAEKMLHEHVWG
jgi:DNA-binding PadR family transcriptional regulator